jgi:hypothetical protein
MPSLAQRILWAVKNVIQESFVYLVKQNLKVAKFRLVQTATGAIKLMRDLQYLECGHAQQAIMQQTWLLQKQEMRPALYVKLDISVKVEIVQNYNVSRDIIAPQELRELLNSLALLAHISHNMEFQVLQAA